MSNNQSQRPIFYEDQYLGADDINAVIGYCRTQQARHDLGAHIWGIAAGLQITEKDSPSGGGQVDVFIQPGYAWDGFGRPIIVLTPYKISAGLFQSIPFDSGNTNGVLVKIWLRYEELSLNPPPTGFGNCSTGDQFSRVQETYRIEIGDLNHTDQQDFVSVAGYSLDAQGVLQKLNPIASPDSPIVLYDESVPYQEFPQDNPKEKWLIPLGSVRWQPNANPSLAGNFLSRGKEDKAKSASQRVYIGVVAGSVQAAEGVIRMRDRTTPPSTVMSDDLVWVEGKLRADKDIRLFNSKIDFLDANGQDKDIPIVIQRQDDTGSKTSLQAVIGKDKQGNNKFSVGPMDATTTPQFEPKFTVLDNGKVGIGTDKPHLTLEIQGDGEFGRDDNNATLHLFGSTIGDTGGNRLFIRAFTGGSVVFDGNNKVGIGTGDPKSALQIAGDLALEPQASGAPRALPTDGTMIWNDGNLLHLNQNLDSSKLVRGVYTPFLAASSLNIGSLGDPGLGNVWITGNLGIGTTAPQAKLQVAGGAIMPAVGNNPSAGIRFPPDPGSGAGDEAFIRYFVESGETTKLLIGCQNDADDRIGFYQFGGERMTIYAGNVGIGTQNPSANLDVAGTVNCSGAMSVGGQMIVNSNTRIVGNLNVTGSFHATTKNFAISHPLHGERQLLVHSCLEGPEIAVFYRGSGQLQQGRAIIRLPDYFEVLTRPDGRTVLLTPKFVADEPIVLLAASEVKNGQFSVRAADDRNPNQAFDWEVKAIRADIDELSVEVPNNSLENPPG
ncbi:MAG: hypothetical protein WCP96_07770 [Methylococcaceae bacterium]